MNLNMFSFLLFVVEEYLANRDINEFVSCFIRLPYSVLKNTIRKRVDSKDFPVFNRDEPKKVGKKIVLAI